MGRVRLFSSKKKKAVIDDVAVTSPQDFVLSDRFSSNENKDSIVDTDSFPRLKVRLESMGAGPSAAAEDDEDEEYLSCSSDADEFMSARGDALSQRSVSSYRGSPVSNDFYSFRDKGDMQLEGRFGEEMMSNLDRDEALDGKREEGESSKKKSTRRLFSGRKLFQRKESTRGGSSEKGSDMTEKNKENNPEKPIDESVLEPKLKVLEEDVGETQRPELATTSSWKWGILNLKRGLSLDKKDDHAMIALTEAGEGLTKREQETDKEITQSVEDLSKNIHSLEINDHGNRVTMVGEVSQAVEDEKEREREREEEKINEIDKYEEVVERKGVDSDVTSNNIEMANINEMHAKKGTEGTEGMEEDKEMGEKKETIRDVTSNSTATVTENVMHASKCVEEDEEMVEKKEKTNGDVTSNNVEMVNANKGAEKDHETEEKTEKEKDKDSEIYRKEEFEVDSVRTGFSCWPTKRSSKHTPRASLAKGKVKERGSGVKEGKSGGKERGSEGKEKASVSPWSKQMLSSRRKLSFQQKREEIDTLDVKPINEGDPITDVKDP